MNSAVPAVGFAWLDSRCRSKLEPIQHDIDMMTSLNGNIFRVTGPLCGEFTGYRWIPLTKASDAWLYSRCRSKLYTMQHDIDMITSFNGNIFPVTGPLYGEFTGHRWIPLINASDAELWCFLWSASWINGWVNDREAGDLRRHRAHYDVIVMIQ